ncbi:MAG TPA: hypothetical protein VF316_23950 [Polyangiaceae bacterium]
MNARNLFRPPPPPPGTPMSSQPTVREELQPEELTDLADEDMEMWAVSGTRILAKPTPTPAPVEATLTSPPAWQQTLPSFHSSYPPVAIAPSEPPPPAVVMVQPSAPPPAYHAQVAMAPRPKTNTLAWVALIVGTSLLGLLTTAAILGATLYG